MTSNTQHIATTRVVFVTLFLFIAGAAIAAGSGTVAAAPESSVEVTDMPREPVQPGDSFTFNVSLTNTGNETGTVTDIRIQNIPDGVSVPSPPLGINGLDPGETSTEQITASIDKNVSDGEYSLTAYGDVGGEKAATTPIAFTVDSTLPLSVDVAPDEISAEETTNVTVTVTEADTGSPVPNANITRLETVQTTPVNGSGSAILTFSPSETGTITLDITADGYFTTTTNITVTEAKPDVDRFDQDGDGIINRQDAVSAVIAYNTKATLGGQPVDRNAAVQAIIAYNTGQRLT